MNKFAKGSLAAGAGLVLLLGGAGTLAYWNDSANLTGGTISTGELKLEANDDMFTESIKTQPTQWVPGDQHTFSTELTLVAEGDNIEGEISLDTSSIVYEGSGFEQFTFEMDMGDVKDIATGATTDDLTFNNAENIIDFDGPGSYTIPVTVTVALPFDVEHEPNASQGAKITADQLTFTATQTATGADTE